jgi:hypothetical protein
VLTLELDHGLRRWYVEICQSLGQWLTIERSQLYLRSIQPEKNGRVGIILEELLKNAGFENVEARMMPLPLCGWPEGLSYTIAGLADVH